MASNKKNNDAEQNKLIAAMGYVCILCFVPLLLKKDSEFAQFHAKQGLALFIAEVVGLILIPLFIVTPIIYAACFIGSCYGIWMAWNGKKIPLPGAAYLIQKLNL